MKAKKVLLFFLLCTVFFINTENIHGTVPAVSSVLTPRDGYFEAYIVIPKRATGIERYAADELAKYIRKITGTEILVIKEKPVLDYFGFYIGMTDTGGKYAPSAISNYEGANGFRIKSVPHGLVIVGGDDVSTLFGIYTFLEEYQECGWFMPYELGEVVPKRESISIPENIDITQVPDIPIRWIGGDDWALKNRMNTNININEHETGVIFKWNFHSYQYLLPAEKYFEDHPEYYSLINKKNMKYYHGKEIEQDAVRYWGITDNRKIHWQTCTSNPEVVKRMTGSIIDTLEHNPDIQFISLTANDGYGFCQCSRCNELKEPERENDRPGIMTGLIHTFNNEVAGRVKKYTPDKLIKTGAYANYFRYPLNPKYKPEDNLVLQVTPNIMFCHNHSITDSGCPYNADFITDFRRWQENIKHLHIYGYNSLHGWANLPWPMVHALRKDIPEYHRLGIELFFTQYWYLSLSYALNYHIAARLIWNSSLDVDELITVFCEKMYGAAASRMEKYHRFLENSWENNPNHVGYWVEPVTLSMPKFYPPDMITEADRLLQEAEQVKADSLSMKRVHSIRVDFDYLRLVLNYLKTISEPFEGIDSERDSDKWDAAVRHAESIGNILSETILKYVEEHYPESQKTHWGTAVENMLRSHLYPDRFIKNKN
ncbi:DUF4838 domain-containing protein [candidate division KSB1 bacterium]